ncbi:MAG: hypothetical protein ACRDWD_16815, partial [Acidimicrobiia bacterium]
MSFRFRTELRTRWRGWLGLALLVGAAAGVVIAAAAGARRTDTAYDRFLDRARFPDAFVAVPAACPSGAGTAVDGPKESARQRCLDPDRVAGLPGVVAAAPLVTVGPGSVEVRTEDGRPLQPDPNDPGYTGPGQVSVVAGTDRRFGTEVDRLKILEGRAPDPEAANEVAVPVEVARRLDLHPDDMLVATFDDPVAVREFAVVGVEAAPLEIAPPSGQWDAFVHATPAFAAEILDAGRVDELEVALRVAGGEAGVDELSETIARRDPSASVFRLPASIHSDVERGIRPYAVALWLVAALTALAALTILGQGLARQTFLDSADYPILGALGLGRRGLFALGLARAGAIGVAGAVVAVGLAIALSPLTPLGTTARTVEPDPGVSLAPPALLLGAVVTVALVLAVVAVPAWRLTRFAGTARDDTARRRRPSTAAVALSRAAMPPTAVTGARMALEPGRGRTAVPVRSTLVGLTLGLLAVTATFTFSASLDHLLATPRLSGWNWDFAAPYPFPDPSPAKERALASALADRPDIEAFAPGTFFRPFPTQDHALELGPDGVPVEILSFDAGSVGPTVLAGRAPEAPNEIALGPVTLDDVGLDIGDSIRAVGSVGEFGRPETLEETSADLDIVGTAVVPIAGGESARLGRGAAMTLDGVRALNPAAGPDVIYLRLAAGADPAVVLAEVAQTLGLPIGESGIEFFGSESSAPSEVLNVERVDRLPLVLAALLAVMATGTLIHMM